MGRAEPSQPAPILVTTKSTSCCKNSSSVARCVRVRATSRPTSVSSASRGSMPLRVPPRASAGLARFGPPTGALGRGQCDWRRARHRRARAATSRLQTGSAGMSRCRGGVPAGPRTGARHPARQWLVGWRRPRVRTTDRGPRCPKRPARPYRTAQLADLTIPHVDVAPPDLAKLAWGIVWRARGPLPVHLHRPD